jgi:uncharacterized protein with HEPN domain
MKDAVRIALEDILAAITEAEGFIEGKDFAGYLNDVRTRRAVERIVEIVSEASRRIPNELKELHAQTPWHAISQIGNRLRHEYHRVDDAIIWGIANRWLVQLKPVIQDLMRHAQSDPDN